MSTDNCRLEPRDTNRGLMRSTTILALGTLASRVLGFVRDVFLAKYLGTTFRADAFFVAFRIPNLFRDVVGEGGVNSSVVPVITAYHQREDRAEFWRFLNVLFVLSLSILSLITLLGMTVAPWIVRLIAPGFMAEPSKLGLTIGLTRTMFPYLILIGLTAYGMGISFSFRAFAVPAFGPCLLNIAMIVSVLLAVKRGLDPAWCLAYGVLIGGLLQLALQMAPIFYRGFRFQRVETLKHPGAFQVGRLLLPRLVGTTVYQMSVFVDTFCASIASVVGQGGISAIYYANRILQFPMGLFGVALATAILPTLSGFSAKQDVVEFKRTLTFALKSILLILLPATVFLLLYAAPIVRILFERGKFDTYSTGLTASALIFYSLGLLAFAGIKIMATSFHALQDTKTPAKVALGCLVLNTILNFILMFPMKIAGIALASAIAGTVNFCVLFLILSRRLGVLVDGLMDYALRILLASVLMGSVSLIVWNRLAFAAELMRLSAVTAASLTAFFLSCYLLNIRQANKFLRWIFKKY